MYVSAINSLSSYAQIRQSQKTNNSTVSKHSPSFKAVMNYAEVFKEAFTSFPRTRQDLSLLYLKLVFTASKGKNVQARKGNQKMITTPIYQMEKALEAVSKNENKHLIVENGKDRVTVCGKKLEFSGDKGDYVAFELDSNQQITFSQNHDDGGDFFKFFKFGNLESHKKVTGSGIAQSSRTTHYNNDGSTNIFKTFFSRLFGV